MSDWEKWIDLEGPEPPAVQELFAPLRAALPSRAEAEDMTRELLEKLAVQEDGATPESALPLRFEVWAELSASFIGAGPEERLDTLDARDIALEDWQRCDAHYVPSLAGDLAARRTTRTHLYARLCGEAVARRKVLPKGSVEEAPAKVTAVAPLPGAPATAAPAPAVATFQKTEQAAPPRAPLGPPPANVRETAVGYEMPTALRELAARLPFLQAKPGEQAPPPPPAPPAAPPTTQVVMGVPVVRSAAQKAMAETFPLDTDSSIFKRPVLPFAEQTMGGTVDFPQWKLTEYATFCAEMACAAPARQAAILEHLHIEDPLVRQAMEDYWKKELATDPTKRAEFDRLFPQYVDWVRRRPRV